MPTLNDQSQLPLPPPQEPKGTKIAALVAAIAVLMAVLSSLFLRLSSPDFKPAMDLQHRTATLAIVLLEIEGADRTFKVRLYSDALDQYRHAANGLDALVKFETKSPKPNDDLLQRYYNVQVILATKTRIAEIGLEASTL